MTDAPGERRAGIAGRVRGLLSSGSVTRFLSALGPTFAALGLQLVAFAITARGLGVSAFGAYAAITAAASICVELVGLGGADLLVRAVARQSDRFAAFFGNMLSLIALTFPPVVLIAFLVLRTQTGEQVDDLHLALALAGEVLVGRVSSSIELAMVAHRHVFRASLVRMAAPLARLAAACGYFWFYSDLEGWIIVVLVQSVLVSAAFVALAAILYGRPVFRVHTGELGAGAAFSINQTARAAQSNLDRVVLSRFADAAAVGIYAAASRVLQLGLFPLQVVTRMLYPQFFVHGEQGIAATRRFAIRCVPVMLAVGVAAGGAVAIAGYFAPFLLGRDFAGSSHVAAMLSLAIPLIAMQYLAADTLTGAGYQKLRAIIYGVSALLFGLLLALGAHLGGIGGMVGAYIGLHALMAIVLWVVAFTIPVKATDPQTSI